MLVVARDLEPVCIAEVSALPLWGQADIYHQMGHSNAIGHYGKPLIAIAVGWASIFGLAVGFGGEQFRSAWFAWLIVLFTHWTLITYLIWLAADFRIDAQSSPLVRVFRKAEGIILVGYKDWLGINVAVLIYKQEGDFERLLCEGTVVNIQGNKLIQISLDTGSLHENMGIELADRIGDGDLKSLIVKPGRSLVV